VWPFFIYLVLFNFWLHFIYLKDSNALRNELPMIVPLKGNAESFRVLAGYTGRVLDVHELRDGNITIAGDEGSDTIPTSESKDET